MVNTNNNGDMDHVALAMLCGVVPPQYREGVKHQFLAPLPENTEPARDFPPERRINPPLP